MLKRVITMSLWIMSIVAIAQTHYIQWVNPIIGTNGMGHTFPGSCSPFGFVQLSPDTDTIPHNIKGRYQKKVYEYCAGYQHKDSTIVGFSHTHFSGTGHSDLGDILIMPTNGKLYLNPGTDKGHLKGYRSIYTHQTEKVQTGYYEVLLNDYNIKAKLTTTPHVGIHEYSYPKNKEKRFILDLNHGIYNYDGKTLWASIRVENDTLLTGYRITNGWARTNYIYFAIALSQPIQSYGYKDFKRALYGGGWGKFNTQKNFPEMAGRKVVAYFNFDNKENQKLTLKVALSAVSTEGALKNLKAEALTKDFDQLVETNQMTWNKELKCVEVEGDKDATALFYTSLYHTMINPSIYMDVDGKYRGLDQLIHQAKGFTNYTVFSLWDTYRAEHPLLNLLKTQQNRDMVVSMIRHQQQSVHGLLPIWSHCANDNWCMSGYHATSVLSDAITKGAKINHKEALKAMVTTSKVPYLEHLDQYIKLGFLPVDKSSIGASTTLEYCYDDWTIYQAALVSGNKEVAKEYKQRALNYRHIYDPQIGFARPRLSNGKFRQKFDLYDTYGQGFIEGNSWNYSFHVPHDVFGLMTMMGGEKEFTKKLTQLFNQKLPAKYYAHNEDITTEGLMGGYVHGNEPSHHVPYLFSWTSQPWKTQYYVREIMDKMYKNNIDGLSGNDDCGQMSAWYIFSAMGFYPVCPGTNQYVLGTPYFPSMKIHFQNGKTLHIIAKGVSSKKRYVKAVRLNGKKHPQLYVTHKELTNGGTLEFIMSSRPNKRRGQKITTKPYSLTNGKITKKNQWDSYFIGNIKFEDFAPETKGSQIYHQIIPNPNNYITTEAKKVLNTLYFSPNDSIVPVRHIHYTLRNMKGVSAKDGGNGEVSIFYSTQHIERSFKKQDTAKLNFETRGVLAHELTHAYQLEPQGIGNYGNSKVFWAFIEGMADAVRLANGYFNEQQAPNSGGSYLDGYRTSGYFFVWLKEHKDKDFLRKFNQSTLHVIPWSFNGGIKYALGKKADIDLLWKEYQKSLQLK